MNGYVREVRHAARALGGNRAFTAAAIATLAIGVGCTAAIFTIVNGVLLRALPVPDANRLVSIRTAGRDAPGRPPTVSIEELRDWQHTTRSFASIAGWRDWGMTRFVGGGTEPAFAIVATPELFELLALQPALGRAFTAADDRAGSNRVVLLTDEYWRERFGADPRVIGRTLRLERGPVADYEIIGVLPPAFTAMPSFQDVKIVAPSSIDPDAATGRERRNRRTFARLRDGASLADARAEMTVVAARLEREHPDTNAGWTVTVDRLIDHEVGPIGDTLRSLLAAVGFLFLITCANIAALQLARVLSRRREFSIRQALGDTRLGLTRTLIVESLLLSLVAGALGLFLSTWLVDLALARGPAMPRAPGVRFDGAVFGFALALSAAAGLLVAMPAALFATRLDVARSLKEESGQVSNPPAARARMVFVAAQVALALVLAGGALMALESLVRQLSLRPGFEPQGLASISISPPQAKYPAGEQIAALYSRLVGAAQAVPGVVSASAVSATPLSGEGEEPVEFTIPGEAGESPRYTANYFNAAAAHFATLGAPIRKGRDFLPTDTASTPAVAIVNDTFVRKYLQDREPIGLRLHLAGNGEVVTIVGVAGDVLRELQPRASANAEIYWPYAQRPRWATNLVVRTTSAAALPAVVDRLRAIDRDLRLGPPRLMTDRVARSSRGPRFLALLFGFFAAVAVLLSGIGVFGLVSYTFAQRVREIGIRVSLGASPARILRWTASSGFGAVAGGGLAGVLGLVALARPLAATLPQLGPVDSLTILVTCVLLLLVGCAACYIPARKAASIDPIRAMRVR